MKDLCRVLIIYTQMLQSITESYVDQYIKPIDKNMVKFILFTALVLGQSCNSAVKSDSTLVRIHSIDSMVTAYDYKLSRLRSGEQKEEDSNIVHGNYSVLTCFDRIDSIIDKIELNEHHSEGRAINFYFMKGSLAMAIFYKSRGYKLVQVGKQYFISDSLIFTLSTEPLPGYSSTLVTADSVKHVCNEALAQ